MDFLDPALSEYAEAFTSQESEVLHELNRQTHLKALKPRMLSGHLQGRTLSMFSHMVRPERILEVGTYTGYSAICLAEGLAENGRLHTIDNNKELEPMAREYFQKAGVSNRIDFHIGDATEVIPELKETWDLIFIDADKENYSRYFDLVIDDLRAGGFIIADNVLWSGKVLQEEANDADTVALRAYNEKVRNNSRVENILLPVRDGLMISRKL